MSGENISICTVASVVAVGWAMKYMFVLNTPCSLQELHMTACCTRVFKFYTCLRLRIVAFLISL